MKEQYSTSDIAKACNKGIMKALKKYEAMTGGSWLAWAPEYFITSLIALELEKVKGTKYIYLESDVKEILKDAKAKKGKNPKEIREGGKVDIVLYDSDDTPEAIIEVKNDVNAKTKIEQDLDRIIGFLKKRKNKSSLRYGVLTFYVESVESKGKSPVLLLDEKVERIFSNIKKQTEEKDLLSILEVSDSIWDFDDGSAYACMAVSIIIKNIA